MALTLFDRIWNDHVVADLGDGWALLHIDRHLLHDLSGPDALASLAERGLAVARPDLSFAIPDHAVSTQPGRTGSSFAGGEALYHGLKERAAAAGIPLFDLGRRGHGIVHVMAPELGIILPGLTLVCGDSHTCTNGALGAIAFGIGTSEVGHVLATQTLRQKKPRQMRINYDGVLAPGVSAKDLALHVIRSLGAAAGVGHAIEHAGPGLERLSMEGRLTLCNMSVELGSKIALCAPDQTTIDYLRGRPFAPDEGSFDAAAAAWRHLRTAPDARVDREEHIDLAAVPPTITWGTSPDQAIAIDGIVPDPGALADTAQARTWRQALDYIAVEPGRPLLGTPVDWVFIGSCANSRLSDLREAATIVRDRRVAEGVTAWVVPGSTEVRAAAEAEGIADIFREAGFAWREPGCSMCVAANGETVASGKRAVSTSNRNFVGRQGPGARTHIASPATAAAAAIAGCIADPRKV